MNGYAPENKVRVVGAPGLVDFDAWMIPGLHEVLEVDGRGPLSVVTDETGCPWIVPARCVRKAEL